MTITEIRQSLPMAQQEPPRGIPQQDWANTPKSVQILVETLLSMVGELQQTIPPLQKRIDQLEEQLGKNSRNSSKLPSSDAPTHKKPPPKPQKERKRGGQVGHERHSRALKPVEEVKGRSGWPYLTEVCRAHQLGLSIPSLLPNAHTT